MGPETRVAIYTRVSTEDQAKEGFSLDAQRERLEAYCKARGWTIAKTYVDDGHSGRDTKRPAYQRMIEERGEWDTLLVIKMDRIHRNSRNFMEMMENLQGWGRNFVSATESFDTSTAMGRFVMDIIQRIAQLESEQIGERVYMGMSQKARTGPGLLGFSIPLGFEVQEGRLTVNPAEAKLVREIFDRCLAGETTEQIAEALNARGARAKRAAAGATQGFCTSSTTPSMRGSSGGTGSRGGQSTLQSSDPRCSTGPRPPSSRGSRTRGSPTSLSDSRRRHRPP